MLSSWKIATKGMPLRSTGLFLKLDELHHPADIQTGTGTDSIGELFSHGSLAYSRLCPASSCPFETHWRTILGSEFSTLLSSSVCQIPNETPMILKIIGLSAAFAAFWLVCLFSPPPGIGDGLSYHDESTDKVTLGNRASAVDEKPSSDDGKKLLA